MKNWIKGGIFICLFILLYIFFSYVFIPKENLSKYGMYNTTMYEILSEKEHTVDTIVVGDSLVYSSVSPMDIYGNFGYTVFDCAEPAHTLPDAYNYFKVAIESQKPKVAIIGANILFRDAKKKPWYNKPLKVLKNSLPLTTNHNNWKKFLFNNEMDRWTNINKGYKKNMGIKPSKNYDYMVETEDKKIIPKANYYYIEKMIEDAKKNNIKLIFIGFPSQKSWYYKKHNAMLELAKEYDITYINLNLEPSISIDWSKDTSDHGDHLNYEGAKKVSKFLGNYLSTLGILKDHRNDDKYNSWNKAYQHYVKC